MRRLAVLVVLLIAAAPLGAAELKPATVAAFDRYVRAAEARMAGELSSNDRFVKAVKAGEFAIEALTTRDGGKRDASRTTAVTH